MAPCGRGEEGCGRAATATAHAFPYLPSSNARRATVFQGLELPPTHGKALVQPGTFTVSDAKGADPVVELFESACARPPGRALVPVANSVESPATACS